MSSDTALKIAALADNSDILTYSWNDRGVAPRGYIRGMAVMFGRVYCKLNAGRDAASEMATADSGDDSVDALTWYATEFTQLGMDNSSPGVDVLRHLFVLLTGLGMRESSGKHCEGQDSTQPTPVRKQPKPDCFRSVTIPLALISFFRRSLISIRARRISWIFSKKEFPATAPL